MKNTEQNTTLINDTFLGDTSKCDKNMQEF